MGERKWRAGGATISRLILWLSELHCNGFRQVISIPSTPSYFIAIETLYEHLLWLRVMRSPNHLFGSSPSSFIAIETLHEHFLWPRAMRPLFGFQFTVNHSYGLQACSPNFIPNSLTF